MTPTECSNTYLFDRMLVSFAISSPILMVIVAGMLPEGTRGTMIVTGHMLLMSILALALVARAAYGIGFMQRVRATVRRAVIGVKNANAWQASR